MTCSPDRRSCSQSCGPRGPLGRAPKAAGDGLDRCERVVDLVAEHPHEPLPGRALLGAERPAQVGQHQQLVGRPSCRKVVPRSSHRPPPPGKVASSVRGVSPSRHAAEPHGVRLETEQALHRLPEQPLAAPVDQPEPALGVEGEHRHVDLLDDAAEQRGGLEGAQSLRAQRIAQHVHLEQREPEPVAGAGAAGANREVALAQRGEQVGDGLERPKHALAHERRADEPGAHGQERERDPDPERVVADPEEPARDQHRRQSREQRGGEDPRLVDDVDVRAVRRLAAPALADAPVELVEVHASACPERSRTTRSASPERMSSKPRSTSSSGSRWETSRSRGRRPLRYSASVAGKSRSGFDTRRSSRGSVARCVGW